MGQYDYLVPGSTSKAPASSGGQYDYLVPKSAPSTPAPTGLGGFVSSVVHGAEDVGSDIWHTLSAPGPAQDSSPDQAMQGLFSDLTDAGNKMISGVSGIFDTHQSALQRGVDAGEAAFGALNAAFAPVNSVLNYAQHVPVLGGIATGLNNLFNAVSTGGSDFAEGAVDALPISDTAKNTVMPLAKEVGALAAQVLSGKVSADVFHGIADKSKTIIDTVAQDAGHTPADFNSFTGNEPTVPESEGVLPTNQSGGSETGLPAEPPSSPVLSPDQHGVLADQYLKQFGNVVNTDNARELFPSYQADRSTSAVVHEDASAVAKTAYNKLLDERQGQGNNTVLFTAGGTGAGKTTAIRSLGNSEDFPVIYDTNTANAGSAIEKIDQALAKGYDVQLNYVHNDIKTSLDNALGRAERMKAEQGSGRTVPLQEHINTHVGAPDAFGKIAEHYKDDPRVSVVAINNEGNNPRPVSDARAFVAGKVYSGSNEDLHAQLKQHVENAHAEGTISPETRNGFIGEPAKGGTGGGNIGSDARGAEEGQGRSRIGASIEQKAVDAKLTQGFDKTAGYDKITLKDQAERATKLVNDNIDTARAIIRGEQPLPDGLRGTSLITAMEEYIKRNPSADLAEELANSPLVTGTSHAAQEMRLMAEREPDSATAKLQELKKSLVDQAGGEKKVEARRAKLVESAKTEMNKVNLSKEDLYWKKFLDTITC